MTWDDFYEYYYDWDETTRIKNLFSVVWLGPSDEVCGIICELAFRHKDAANRLAGKALAQKIVFSAEEIQDLAGTIDDRLLEKLLWQAADSYSKKDPLPVKRVCVVFQMWLLFCRSIHCEGLQRDPFWPPYEKESGCL